MKLECPSCGANVKYIIGTHQVLCTHCNEKFDIDSLTKKLYSSSKQQEKGQEYCCSSCGARFTSIDNSILKLCNFCGSENITSSTLNSSLVTRKIIPFEISQEQMIQKFEEFIKSNPLSNSDYFNVNNIKKISGLYIPVKVCKYDAKFHTFSSFYNGTRFPYEFYSEYEATITVDSLKDYPDLIFKNLLPYNLNKSVDYSPYYLTDFFTVTGDDFYESKIKESKIDILKKTLNDVYFVLLEMPFKNHETSDQNIFKNNKNQALLELNTSSCENYFFPVWTCSYKFKDTEYTFAVNGQNGKVVSVLPLDEKKAKRFYRITAIKTNTLPIIALLFFTGVFLYTIIYTLYRKIKLPGLTIDYSIFICFIIASIGLWLVLCLSRGFTEEIADRIRSSADPNFNAFFNLVNIGNTHVKYIKDNMIYTYQNKKEESKKRIVPEYNTNPKNKYLTEFNYTIDIKDSFDIQIDKKRII